MSLQLTPDGASGEVAPLIEVVCVAYRRPGLLKVLIQSFINQTCPHWRLKIYHDSADDEIATLVSSYADPRVSVQFSAERSNDYGHSQRAWGLRQLAAPYVLITNDDNYYVPRFVEFLKQVIDHHAPDAVMFDMVHSHGNPGGRAAPPYSYFPVQWARRAIDMGAAIVRSELAARVGFRDKGFDGDATYFEDVAAAAGEGFRLYKLNQVLFVHN